MLSVMQLMIQLKCSAIGQLNILYNGQIEYATLFVNFYSTCSTCQ